MSEIVAKRNIIHGPKNSVLPKTISIIKLITTEYSFRKIFSPVRKQPAATATRIRELTIGFQFIVFFSEPEPAVNERNIPSAIPATHKDKTLTGSSSITRHVNTRIGYIAQVA